VHIGVIMQHWNSAAARIVLLAWMGVPSLLAGAEAATLTRGEINPLTGRFAAHGTALHRGIQLAVEEAKASGRLRITLVSGDDEGRPDRAVAAAEELTPRVRAAALEGRRLFLGMTVRENLEVGAYLGAARIRIGEALSGVHTRFPVLRGKEKMQAATLSGGEQQMLALGRGLMAQPKVLMLDDPFMGLAPRIMAGRCDTLPALASRGIGVLIVGQHVRRILTLAGRAYLLEQGRITTMPREPSS